MLHCTFLVRTLPRFGGGKFPFFRLLLLLMLRERERERVVKRFLLFVVCCCCLCRRQRMGPLGSLRRTYTLHQREAIGSMPDCNCFVCAFSCVHDLKPLRTGGICKKMIHRYSLFEVVDTPLFLFLPARCCYIRNGPRWHCHTVGGREDDPKK